jgi:hypothetical protein
MIQEPSYTDGLRHAHFSPLCSDLQLTLLASDVAEGGSVTVFFEEDRGLCWLGIGPRGSDRAMCSVEALATRFPRQRVMTEGFQRLSLSEQSDFLRATWTDLQVMFSPAHVRETIAWNNARQQALTDKYAKRT